VTRVGGRVADPVLPLSQLVCVGEAIVILFLMASIIGSVTSTIYLFYFNFNLFISI
jgi:hypothetical protein